MKTQNEELRRVAGDDSLIDSAEFLITDKMIKAGAAELSGYSLKFQNEEDWARDVFEVMIDQVRVSDLESLLALVKSRSFEK